MIAAKAVVKAVIQDYIVRSLAAGYILPAQIEQEGGVKKAPHFKALDFIRALLV